MEIKRLYKIVKSLLFISVVEFVSLFKVNVLIGAKYAAFSAVNCVAPLAVPCSGSFLSLALLIGRRMIKSIALHGLFVISPLVYHIPTLFASVYWMTSNIGIRLITPLICIFLFIVHPIGAQAWLYATLWLIPIVLYFFPHHNIVVQAVGSTFVQHAVGSVLWLYWMPAMSAQYWIALIPVACVERCIFASGMIIAYTTWHFLINFFKKIYDFSIMRMHILVGQ